MHDGLDDPELKPWRCKGMGLTRIFYSTDNPALDAVNTRWAKAICATCASTVECAALGADEVYGIWGGLKPSERRRRRPGDLRTHCKRGHEYTNINSRGSYCRVCNRMYAAQRRERALEAEKKRRREEGTA